MWPLIFFLSALTDFPMPPPKGKKQGQHRDWGFLPVFVVLGIIAISTYSYIARVCRKSSEIALMTILPLACAFVFICYLFHFFYGLIYL
jgi:hypothetical protein